jgi:diguanylate cyclase (GGDEF)-like protein
LNLDALRRSSGHEWLVAAGLLVLLALFVGAVAGQLPGADAVSMQIQPMPGNHGGPSIVSTDGRALLVGGGDGEGIAARLHFSLPAKAPGDGQWMIWMERNPVDSVQLHRGTWHSVQRGFFHPDASAGPMPSGYVFPLPHEWRGDIDLDLRVRGNLPTRLQPRLVGSDEAWRIERQGIAIGAMVYASLFTLALLALALFSASRDRLFLSLFGCATITVLTLAAVNGHLYQTQGLRWFAGWRAQGLLALAFLLFASMPQLLLQYAGTRVARPQMARVVDLASVTLAVLAGACLLDLQPLLPWLLPQAKLGRVACAVICLLLVFDAARRRIPMAWPLAILALLTAASGAFRELVLAGRLDDLPWLRSSYQVTLTAAMAILAVGVVSRISEYRDQRDRDQLARLDSERRMQREAARSDLNAALQSKLRACTEGDIEWAAFRLLLDHLVPLVRAESAVALARGYHGQDVQVVLPATRKAEVEAAIGRRELVLKRHAANGIPLQQPVTAGGSVAMEAMVPLQIRAPAWGVLLLERAGGEGFTTEELALAGEFARLALVHIDQALASIQLRRSAELDALTGTFNRRTIDQWVARSFSDAERDVQPVSVLFVDMDHFKAINDKYGHACGDQCLRAVAQALRSALGDGDLLGRYGGEEFIAVLPGRGGAAARVVGEQLRSDVERLTIDWEGQALRLTVSVGVATRLDEEARPADTIDRADKALYAAKRNGRNCVHVAPAIFS